MQELYLRKIRKMAPCRVVETQEARGFEERFAEKIREIEARRLEKHFKDDYIVCLFDEGKEMTSVEFTRFLEKRFLSSTKVLMFVVGGFLGLGKRVFERADLCLSLSKMTLSHELCRIVLLEQIYRSLTMMKGESYAK